MPRLSSPQPESGASSTNVRTSKDARFPRLVSFRTPSLRHSPYSGFRPGSEGGDMRRWFVGLVGVVTPALVLAATQGGPLGVSLPLFPATNWWNVDVSAAPLDPPPPRSSPSSGGTRTLHPDFGGEVSSGQRRDLRHALRRRGRHAAEEGRLVRLLGRERRRFTRPAGVDPLLPDPGRGDHPAALDRGRAAGEPGPGRRPAHADRRHGRTTTSTSSTPCLATAAVERRARGLLRHEHEQPPPRGLDLGRRGRPRDPPGPRPLRRGLRRPRRSATPSG